MTLDAPVGSKEGITIGTSEETVFEAISAGPDQVTFYINNGSSNDVTFRVYAGANSEDYVKVGNDQTIASGNDEPIVVSNKYNYVELRAVASTSSSGVDCYYSRLQVV